jgi:phage terminase large subunit-like protein
MDFAGGYRGFLAFCRAVEVDLQPHQKRVARAHFGAEREVVAILPRGSIKSTLASLLAVHHVLTVDDPGVYVGASTRDQARIIGAMVRRLVRHPAIRSQLVWRTDAVRWARDPTGPAVLQVVPSDGSAAHGWPRPTFLIADEIWAWSDREPTLLGAMLTSMLKVPTCRFLGISVSAARLDSPLGRLRERAMAAPSVERKGVVTDAGGAGLRWIEWSLSEDEDAEDFDLVAQVNPLRTAAEMREQRERVTEVEWKQFHCCMWGIGEGQWLPPGAWSACADPDLFSEVEPVYLGVDIGGNRSASALIGVTEDLEVAEVFIAQGDAAVLEVAERIREIAAGRPVLEVAFDPMRFMSEALRLEADGLPMVKFDQGDSRMIPASENLHRLITEGKLSHPGDAELDRHIAAAVAKQTRRGWRLDKLTKGAQIDGAVALAMACSRAVAPRSEVKLVGWV